MMAGANADQGVATSILVIEDEPGIADLLRRGLAAERFHVEAELDGEKGERRALREGFDMVVLDLMAAGRSGLEVLESLQRSKPAMPVIVLSARGALEDRLAGLQAGAVDYVVRPFSPAELIARIRAHLRAQARASTTTLRAEGIELDLLTRRARRGEREIRLSPTEFELLAYLLRHPGEALTREQILGAVWHSHDPSRHERLDNVVDVYIGYLRRKLSTRESGPTPIFTVPSVGYRLGHAR
jgi:DNA-binding response OmpR family regulator